MMTIRYGERFYRALIEIEVVLGPQYGPDTMILTKDKVPLGKPCPTCGHVAWGHKALPVEEAIAAGWFIEVSDPSTTINTPSNERTESA